MANKFVQIDHIYLLHAGHIFKHTGLEPYEVMTRITCVLSLFTSIHDKEVKKSYLLRIISLILLV